jgi:hypothetical protein
VKKAIAIVLVLILAVSLIACKTSGSQTEESSVPSPSPSASTAPPSAAPATEDTAPEVSAPPQESTAPASTVGYITADVDHFARDTYKLADFYYAPLTLEKLHFDAMKSMEPVLNIEMTEFSGNENADLYIQNFEIASQQDFDGFVIESYPDVFDRMYEVLNDLGIPYIYTVNAYRDANGANLVPTVVLDQYKNGNTQAQWFYDHYKDYWGNIDASKIVLLSLEYSKTRPHIAQQGA